MLAIDVLLTESQLAEDFVAGLERRYLPEKFFYWFPLSVKAWLDLCQSAQPYKNYSRSYELVSKHAADIAGRCPAALTEPLELVGLGAGQGDKDLVVLQALQSSGRTLRYRPVDSSQALLEMAVGRARRSGFEVRGLKADLEDAETVETLSAAGGGPRLYLLLGNSLGILNPLEFLRTLRGLLRPEDFLLLDGEIYDHASLQGYDNPVNRRFAFAPLASLGLEEGRDGALVFEDQIDGQCEGLHRVSKHFRAVRKLKISVAGRWLELGAEDKIAMNSSWKFSAAAFRGMLGEPGRLAILREYWSDDRRFAMALAARAKP